MRFVIIGAGAIGGVAGARLQQAGHDVTLIARGLHLDAIHRHGLTLLAPDERAVLRIAAEADPAAVRWRGDEVVLLATKSQDSAPALIALRDAAGPGVPVACLQNGVENERIALRLFHTVYGAAVMMPTAHVEPGVVESYGAPLSGMLGLGRYPEGVDDGALRIARALTEARLQTDAVPDVMRLKYAKLLLNLGNAVDALCGRGAHSEAVTEQARVEGRAVLAAAGIAHEAGEVTDVIGRWRQIGVREIEGRRRAGSSSWQSLQRGAGAIETDYLNGEIVLLGRLHGVPAPVNAALCRLAADVARRRGAPGSVKVDEILAAAA